MMYLVCFVESLLPEPVCQTCLALLGEDALRGGGIEGQRNRIVGDGLVVLLGIRCDISEMLQFLEATLPEA